MTVIVLVLIFAAVYFALRSVFRKKGCGCGCSGCSKDCGVKNG